MPLRAMPGALPVNGKAEAPGFLAVALALFFLSAHKKVANFIKDCSTQQSLALLVAFRGSLYTEAHLNIYSTYTKETRLILNQALDPPEAVDPLAVNFQGSRLRFFTSPSI